MPIGPGLPGFPWTYQSIMANAPDQSGVYAIYNQNQWIYFGEGKSVRARLLAHWNGDNPCILTNNPTGFNFELMTEAQRVARQNALIAGGSLCNQMFG